MIVIQIVDWRSYLGRSDMKNVTWLKLSTALIDDPKLFGLTAEQKWAWIYILNQAVTHGKSGELSTTLDRLVHFSGVNKKSLQGALEHFVKARLIDPVDNSAQLLEVNVQQLEVADSNFKSKKVGKKTEVIDLTDDELDLGRKWLDMAVSEMPHRASDPKWHAAEFGTELKKVGHAVGLDQAGMLKVFHYVSADAFWRPNACAPKSLLKVNKEGVRKIDNILTRMKRPAERLADIREEQRADITRPLNEDGVTIEDVHYWFRNK